MAVPGFQSFLLPILEYLKDGKEANAAQIGAYAAKAMKISESDIAIKLPSGKQGVFENRTAWARFYLKKAGLIISPRRGLSAVSETGLKFLSENPSNLDLKTLDRFPAYVEFKNQMSEKEVALEIKVAPSDETPQETIEKAYALLNSELEAEILRRVMGCTPSYFERLVVELLVAMGYGGSLADAGRAVGKSGDGGIDGVIKEDKLGLDVVYLQAKRWESGVGRPEIQKFVGALAGQRASKGVFITTSSYSQEARTYADSVQQKIILIDGKELAKFMIEHNQGVTSVAKYDLKRIDNDFFEEE